MWKGCTYTPGHAWLTAPAERVTTRTALFIEDSRIADRVSVGALCHLRPGTCLALVLHGNLRSEGIGHWRGDKRPPGVHRRCHRRKDVTSAQALSVQIRRFRNTRPYRGRGVRGSDAQLVARSVSGKTPFGPGATITRGRAARSPGISRGPDIREGVSGRRKRFETEKREEDKVSNRHEDAIMFFIARWLCA